MDEEKELRGHEKDLSAPQQKKKQKTRFPQENEDTFGEECAQKQAEKREMASHREVGEEIVIEWGGVPAS